MTAQRAGQIINEYLARLESALAPVAPPRRVELMNDIRAHITEARAELVNETDADILNILDRLGDPAEMAAAEERAEPAPPSRRESRGLEIAAIVLLLLFWPFGVILLWVSNAWTTREKLIGTLVPPGGYIGAMVFGAFVAWGTVSASCSTMTDDLGRVISSTCPSDGVQAAIDVVALLLALIYLVGPILSAAFLASRLRRKSANHASTLATTPRLAG